MSADRELLELAAKAAGVCLHPEEKLHRSYGNWGCDTTCMACRKDPSDASWRPLTDDGDAFRLAVTLGISVFPPYEEFGDFACTTVPGPDSEWFQELTDGSDRRAATRRAIVRAAAQIGRSM